MFTVTSSCGDRGYTREVWTWSRDMGEGGSEHALIAASGKHESYSFFYLLSKDQKVV